MFPGVEPTVITRARAHELVEAYTEVLEKSGPVLAPELAEAFSRRAAVFSALGRHAEAMQDAVCCLRLDAAYR
jgi:hypothetical protein